MDSDFPRVAVEEVVLPVVAVPFAHMRRLICDKDCGTAIAAARVCEVSLVMANGGDVSLVGFETCENLLSSLHGQSRGRHSWVSSQGSIRSFDRENVSAIGYARVHRHDVNVKRQYDEVEASVNAIDWSR
jgi:hypothetical protein